MKYTNPDSLVSPDWLVERLREPRLRVVDLRFEIRPGPGGRLEPTAGRSDFDDGHIPGAVFVDMNADLAHPGAPLEILSPERFEALMGRLGIGNDTTVVIYDASGGTWAARLWWALRYYGHDDVRLLDGGYARWLGEGHPTETAEALPTPARFESRARPALRVTRDDVLAAINDDDICIIDALPEPFFLGTAKLYPDLRAGHIPGARNLPAPANLDPESSTLLSAETLDELWASAGVSRDKRVITYCGGGVFAAFALFALHLLGYEEAALYDASWSEWGADESLPVEIGPGSSPPG
jgi:thiosulfate/3-mercaptopyruvate sulfurtransferase